MLDYNIFREKIYNILNTTSLDNEYINYLTRRITNEVFEIIQEVIPQSDEEVGTCFFCGDEYPLSDLKQTSDCGPICDTCLRAIKSRGETVTIIE